MKNDYKYLAFISYNNEDKRFAQRLSKALQNYRFPMGIRHKNADVRSQREIFSYTDDLTGVKLHPEIISNLEESEYLVVICSPSAKKSAWVNKEILEYDRICKARGEEPKIIPIVIKGEAYANDEAAECLPDALKKLDMDCPEKKDRFRRRELRKEGFKHIKLDLLATMHNTQLSPLIQSDRRAKWLQCLLLVFALLGLAYAFFYLSQEDNYFENYKLTPEGGVEGINPLRRWRVWCRNTSYYIKTEGKLVTVKRINSAGNITPDDNYDTLHRPSILEVTVNGTNSSQIESNSAETPEKSYTLIPTAQGYFIRFDNSNGKMPSMRYHFHSGSSVQENIKSDQEWDVPMNTLYREFYNDPSRRIKSIRFYYTTDNKFVDTLCKNPDCKDFISHNDEGIFSENYSYVEKPDTLIETIIFLDPDNIPMNCKRGYAGIENTYVHNRLVLRRFLNKNGDTGSDIYRRSYIRFEYDKHYGNQTKIDFLKTFVNDTKKTPVNGPDGYATKVIKYGWKWIPRKGFRRVRTKESLYDEKGKPCIGKDGYHAVQFDKFDTHGWVTEKSFFNEENRIFQNTVDSCVYVRIKYNDHGNIVTKAFFDINMKPAIKDGFDLWKADYNNYEQRSKVCYYLSRDISRDTTKTKLAMQRSTNIGGFSVEYDSWGHITKMRYYGQHVSDTLSISNNWKCARWEMAFDDNTGQVKTLKCFDADNNLTTNIEGCAGWVVDHYSVGLKDLENSFDRLPGRRIRKFTFKNKDWKTADNNEQYSVSVYLYNELGKKLRCTFDPDTTGYKPKDRFQYRSYRQTYDEETNCNIVKKEFYDDDILARASNDTSTWRLKYSDDDINALPYAKNAKTYIYSDLYSGCLIHCSFWEATWEQNELTKRSFYQVEGNDTTKVGTLLLDKDHDHCYNFYGRDSSVVLMKFYPSRKEVAFLVDGSRITLDENGNGLDISSRSNLYIMASVLNP